MKFISHAATMYASSLETTEERAFARRYAVWVANGRRGTRPKPEGIRPTRETVICCLIDDLHRSEIVA